MPPRDIAATTSTERAPTYGTIQTVEDGPGGAGLIKANSERDAISKPLLWDDWASAAVIAVVVLVGDLARGIFFPTISTYVRMMGGSHVTQVRMSRVAFHPISRDASDDLRTVCCS